MKTYTITNQGNGKNRRNVRAANAMAALRKSLGDEAILKKLEGDSAVNICNLPDYQYIASEA